MISMPITVICPDSMSVGFELAGTRAFGVRGSDEAREIILELLQMAGFGIVLVADDLTGSLSERERNRLEASQSPVFVPMPLKIPENEAGRVVAENIVEKLIQKAIGRKVAIAG